MHLFLVLFFLSFFLETETILLCLLFTEHPSEDMARLYIGALEGSGVCQPGGPGTGEPRALGSPDLVLAVPRATVQERKGEVQLETSMQPLLSLDAHQCGAVDAQAPPAEPSARPQPQAGAVDGC